MVDLGTGIFLSLSLVSKRAVALGFWLDLRGVGRLGGNFLADWYFSERWE